MRTNLNYVSIRPGYIAIYSQPDGIRRRSQLQIENEVNLKDNRPEGLISLKAERRIKQGIDWLLWLSKEKWFYHRKHKRNYRFRINFITLTLSSRQIHSDNVIKKELLNHFLIEARKKWNVVNYLWRAEPQKNGNIHFHLCFDQFVPWHELKNVWNRIQNKLGYIDRFHEQHNHRNPNSTDVHAVAKIRNISAYLAKYCTKQSDIREIQGKLWGLSTGLSKMKAAIDLRCNDIEREIRQIGDEFPEKVYSSDYVTAIYVNVSDWIKVVQGRLFQVFREYVEQYREFFYSKAPPDIVGVV